MVVLTVYAGVTIIPFRGFRSNPVRRSMKAVCCNTKERPLLEHLSLKNVGPAPEMEMDLSPRLNLITGDNGLGKTFLLDIAWWALTETWARGILLPHAAPSEGEISYFYTTASGTSTYLGHFNRRSEQWSVIQPRIVKPLPFLTPIQPFSQPDYRTIVQQSRLNPGLVLYAQVDGGFSVYDPARNQGKSSNLHGGSAFLFTTQEVWEGNTFCEGLIRDWASWQREGNEAFKQLQEVLRLLSPSLSETLKPGDLRKISVDDPKRYPTLKMPYGQEVPVIHASAGMRRIIALAYLLVWSWQEHVAACELRGEVPASEIVFLIDEVEAHLHPQWQRRIVPALLSVMDGLMGTHAPRVQLIATTHAPLVLASVESLFDPEKDGWFDLDLVQDARKVALTKREFIRRGDVSNWLTSEAFDLKEARSLEAEEAITQAMALVATDAPAHEEIERVDALLRNALSDIDRFWLRWSAFRRSREVAA